MATLRAAAFSTVPSARRSAVVVRASADAIGKVNPAIRKNEDKVADFVKASELPQPKVRMQALGADSLCLSQRCNMQHASLAIDHICKARGCTPRNADAALAELRFQLNTCGCERRSLVRCQPDTDRSAAEPLTPTLSVLLQAVFCRCWRTGKVSRVQMQYHQKLLCTTRHDMPGPSNSASSSAINTHSIHESFHPGFVPFTAVMPC